MPDRPVKENPEAEEYSGISSQNTEMKQAAKQIANIHQKQPIVPPKVPKPEREPSLPQRLSFYQSSGQIVYFDLGIDTNER
jgi:hypothetical protein